MSQNRRGFIGSIVAAITAWIAARTGVQASTKEEAPAYRWHGNIQSLRVVDRSRLRIYEMRGTNYDAALRWCQMSIPPGAEIVATAFNLRNYDSVCFKVWHDSFAPVQCGCQIPAIHYQDPKTGGWYFPDHMAGELLSITAETQVTK